MPRPLSAAVLRLMGMDSIETFLNSGALPGQSNGCDGAPHSMMVILFSRLAARPGEEHSHAEDQ